MFSAHGPLTNGQSGKEEQIRKLELDAAPKSAQGGRIMWDGKESEWNKVRSL
jgi:hypothetical protein